LAGFNTIKYDIFYNLVVALFLGHPVASYFAYK